MNAYSSSSYSLPLFDNYSVYVSAKLIVWLDPVNTGELLQLGVNGHMPIFKKGNEGSGLEECWGKVHGKKDEMFLFWSWIQFMCSGFMALLRHGRRLHDIGPFTHSLSKLCYRVAVMWKIWRDSFIYVPLSISKGVI